jgi:bifunctional DNase/RNase
VIRMIVHGLTIDPASNSPILILKDPESERTLPIWIGLLEATAIASELESVTFSRPMTHDLIRNLLEATHSSVARVEVTELKGQHLLRSDSPHRRGRRVGRGFAPF